MHYLVDGISFLSRESILSVISTVLRSIRKLNALLGTESSIRKLKAFFFKNLKVLLLEISKFQNFKMGDRISPQTETSDEKLKR